MDWGEFAKETVFVWGMLLGGAYGVVRAGTSEQWIWLIISGALVIACFGLLQLERERLSA